MNDIFQTRYFYCCKNNTAPLDINKMNKNDTVESKHVVLIGAMYIQSIQLGITIQQS